jgi:DNA invertase Pin-like site-specific DNA recombinase
MSKSRPLAFSYVRFSSAEQAKGDSLRRQEEARDAWLAKSGAALDTSLTLRDEGVSAFTGKHRSNPDRNALAAFLEMVQRGRVPKGSYLVIENLDRLSREHVQPALLLVLNLLQAGVRIVQLKPTEMVFDEKSEMMPLMMALLELSRGNSESQMKSDRVGEAWQRKKLAARGGKPQTRMCPAWLRVEGKSVESYRFVVVQAAAEVVRRIYRLAAAGYGTPAITKLFNTEGVLPIGGRTAHWSKSFIASLLTGRAVLGEYQPRRIVNGRRVPDGPPITNFFPPIITEDEWHAARAAMAGRLYRGGRPTKRVNIFQGLLRDARTGDALVLAPKGKGGADRQYTPARALRGLDGGPSISFRVGVLEDAILGQLREIDPREVLPPSDGAADKVLTLTGKLTALEARAEKLKARLVEEDDLDDLIGPLRELEARRKAVADELAGAKREAASPLSESWGELGGLLDALKNAPDPDDARIRLRSALRRTITGIWCVFVTKGHWKIAAVQLWFRGDGQRNYLILHRRVLAMPRKRAPEQLHVRSFADPDVTGLDLRKPKDAAKLLKLLESIDPAELWAGAGA